MRKFLMMRRHSYCPLVRKSLDVRNLKHYITVTTVCSHLFSGHSWKYQYSATCLSNSILHLSSTNSPSYGTLLQIDQEIRNFPVPSHLWPTSTVQENSLFTWSQLATRASQQYGVLCVKEASKLGISPVWSMLCIHTSRYFIPPS